MTFPDRIARLQRQNNVTGIDFISVDAATQKILKIHFYKAPGTLTIPLQTTLLPGDSDTLKKYGSIARPGHYLTCL